MVIMKLHLYKVIFIIELFLKIFEVIFIRMYYILYIYRKVIFIIVKDNSEYFIYYDVYIHQNVVSYIIRLVN